MANKSNNLQHDSIGAWTKRCYFAGRAAMDAVLRPYDLGATQFYILYQLAHDGPTMQRDLLRMLQVERATLSVIIGTLVTLWSGQDLAYSPGFARPMVYWDAILFTLAAIFGVAGVRLRRGSNEFLSY